jgi:hypothetical protein
MRFFPSRCAERGPVAETEVGTVGNGRGGSSLLIRHLGFAVEGLPGCEVVFISMFFPFPFLVVFTVFSLDELRSGGSEVLGPAAFSSATAGFATCVTLTA